jgi:hypothetical protein
MGGDLYRFLGVAQQLQLVRISGVDFRPGRLDVAGGKCRFERRRHFAPMGGKGKLERGGGDAPLRFAGGIGARCDVLDQGRAEVIDQFHQFAIHLLSATGDQLAERCGILFGHFRPGPGFLSAGL